MVQCFLGITPGKRLTQAQIAELSKFKPKPPPTED